MQIINPATEELITTLIEDDASSLHDKWAVLRQAQPGWANENLSDRMDILEKFHELLDEKKDQLAAILTREVGKPLQQSLNEIQGARSRIRWMLDHAVSYFSEEWMTPKGDTREKITYEPLGVICNISAWNYPYLVGVNVFVPALLAGNAVLYKPSEHATLTGLEIQKLLYQAGVPENIFQLAVGGKETGALLTELDFDGYFFTGSYRTGRQIYEKVAGKMVPCQLEMGGKDPLYITDDVDDPEKVAAATADGAFYNNGQSCCAVERIYAHESVYDKYVSGFLQQLARWKLGSPTEKDIYFGPIARKENMGLLEDQVQDAVSRGAILKTGGKRVEGKGYYFLPTVLTHVDHTMRIMKEESFGPVIGIMKVKDDAEAVRWMKDTEYGLTASVYSGNQERAESILRKIDAGTGYWNCCDRVSAAVPWSGRKHSGFGVTLSHQGMRALTRPKSWHLRK